MTDFERKIIVPPEKEAMIKEMTPEKEELKKPSEGAKRLEKQNELKQWIKSREDKQRQEKVSPEGNKGKERESIAEWLEDMLKGQKEYSETLLINPDGTLNKIKKSDGFPPDILNQVEANTAEDLFNILREIQQEYSEYRLYVEINKGREWIKYKVSKVE